MTVLVPTRTPIPIAWIERMNQKPKSDGESRIQALTADCSIVWRKAGGRANLEDDYRALQTSPLAWMLSPPAPQQYRVQAAGGLYVVISRLRYSG
jgi:hypothetical protein